MAGTTYPPASLPSIADCVNGSRWEVYRYEHLSGAFAVKCGERFICHLHICPNWEDEKTLAHYIVDCVNLAKEKG